METLNQKINKAYLVIKTALDTCALDLDSVGNSYYIAKCWVTDLAERACRNSDVAKIFIDYAANKSTIKLKALLRHVHFNEKNLNQFNAFDLLDTSSNWI